MSLTFFRHHKTYYRFGVVIVQRKNDQHGFVLYLHLGRGGFGISVNTGKRFN